MNAATSFILIKMQAERNYFLANAPETVQPSNHTFPRTVFCSFSEAQSGKGGRESRINPFHAIASLNEFQRRDEEFSLLETAVIFPSRTLCNQMSRVSYNEQFGVHTKPLQRNFIKL